MKKLLFVSLFAIGFQTGRSQVTITPISNSNSTVLTNYLQGFGLTISNMNITGGNSSLAFCSGNSPLAFGSGIMMSTGRIDNTINSPSSTFLSTDHNLPGDADLAALIWEPVGNLNDACIIEFDCIPTYSNITFDFAFGSEEYNEFVGLSYNDVFGILLSGQDTSGTYFVNKNLAVVPETSIPVSVNNINNGINTPANGPCTNCQYFYDNSSGQIIALDGLTIGLQGSATVIPGQIYHFKIGIADVTDGIYDSQVMFLTNSFRSIAPVGLKELNTESGIELFPNPAKGKFSISAKGIIIEKAEIYTIDGKLISSSVFEKGNNSVNTENLSKGIYLVHIYSSSEKVVKKLVIE